MHNELISVIVPVYKVEGYLERCVNSILAQSYTNFELILVDDGSPDKCPLLCDSYKEMDDRVKVFHKSNGGLSSARNAGMAAMEGMYVTFIDSDDWVDSRYLEYLYKLLVESNADISACDLYDSFDGEMPTAQLAEPELYSGIKALELMLYQTGFTNSASGKLFKKEHVSMLQFPIGKYHEDLWTIYRPIAESGLVAYGRTALYCYLHHEGGITHSATFDKSISDLLEGIDSIEEYVNRYHPEIIGSLVSRKFSCIAQVLNSYDNLAVSEGDDRLWGWIRAHRIGLLLDKRARNKNRTAAAISLLGKSVFLKAYRNRGMKKVG